MNWLPDVYQLYASHIRGIRNNLETSTKPKKTVTTKTQIEIPDKNAIRPFQVNFPEADLTDLRKAHQRDKVA